MPEPVSTSGAHDQRAVMAAYREIESALTAPGCLYETFATDFGDRSVRNYLNVPGNLYDIVAGFGARHSDEVFVIGDSRTFTYGEVFEQAGRLAAALVVEYGIGPGDRVGIMMANDPMFLVGLFGIAQLGAVAVLYNGRAGDDEVAAAVTDVPSRVVIADAERTRVLGRVAGEVPVIVTSPQPDLPHTRSLDDLLDAFPTPVARRVISPDDACLVLFTSGTSGRAKGVALSHRNICNVVMNMRFVTDTNIEFAARTYDMQVDDVRAFLPRISALLIFPLFHVSGIAALMNTMNSGGFIATMSKWDPAAAADLISEHEINMLAAPPMVIDDLLSLPSSGELLRSLTNVSPGGQSTPPNVAARINTELPGARRAAGWGLTEVGGSVCVAGGDILSAFPDTVGPVSPTMDVRVVDLDGHALSAGAVGELQLSGGLVTAGYVGLPEESATSFREGWFRTGDVGYIDEFGLVYVVDRMKDIVISAGENISCVEVESALTASDMFVDVAAFGVPDERLGERLVVAVTLRKPEVPLTEEEVRTIAAKSLPRHKLPREVLVSAKPLPRNATGKLIKREIRRRYLEAGK